MEHLASIVRERIGKLELDDDLVVEPFSRALELCPLNARGRNLRPRTMRRDA